MKITLTVVLLACTPALLAQEIRLRSSLDSAAVPYAHIQGKSFRAISNLEGKLEWPARWPAGDTLKISCIGFEPMHLSGPARDTTLYMNESTTTLKPVVISGLSVEERLFRAVDAMQRRGDWKNERSATYWRGVFEEDALVERFVARMTGRPGAWQSDSVQVADGCASFDLSSLSDEHSLFDQNHVFPAAGSLSRENETLWEYRLAGQELVEGALHSRVEATFYSPEKYVDHTFTIWLNEDRQEVLRIEIHYAWHLDFPVTLNRQPTMESNLRAYSGHVLFQDGQPVYLDARYVLEVCDKFRPGRCYRQEVYHELFVRQGNRAVLPVNVQFFEYIAQGLSCEPDL